MSLFRSPRLRRFCREWVVFLAIPVLLALSFRSAVADWNDVPTGSMIPTILEGDRIFVNKLAYDLKIPFTSTRVAQWADPRHGDVVILASPDDGTRLVKRVCAVPGDIVSLRNNVMHINGRALVYTPGREKDLATLPPANRTGHRLVTETLGTHEHAVMTSPGRNARRNFGPVTVPPGKFFVMGDNRDNSLDSRYFGFVDREVISGQVTGVVASVELDNWYKPRWERFFRHLD